MNNRFFAACNSYFGFKSYFNNIFDSGEFDRIFILKGAPGSGKSTFMKRVAFEFKDHADDIEYFYCSSDTSSLDGLLVEKAGKRVGIIDGTAPHERDAVIVGAIDEIVNLAEGLDSEWLDAERDNILSLSEEKRQAYKTAYSYLNMAGICYTEICKYYKECFDECKAYKYIRSLGYDKKISGKGRRVRLISSFSKDGYKRIDGLASRSNSSIKIGGDIHCARLLLTLISEYFSEDITVCPYPLSPSTLDAAYSKTVDTLYLTVNESECDICTDEFFRKDRLGEERIRVARGIHNNALAEAQRWLGIASDIHFRLEEIYSRCMNFERNDEAVYEVCKKINKVFDIQN